MIESLPTCLAEECLLEGYTRADRLFFQQDSITVGKALVGALIATETQEGLTVGKIVEIESYPGDEPASHVFNQLKRTPRTAIQYMDAGHLYMYLIMGLHHMTSIVTNEIDVPDVVFIRAVEPVYGFDLMSRRRNYAGQDLRSLTAGPGRLSQAFGLNVGHQGLDIFSDESFLSFWLPNNENSLLDVKAGLRINLGVGKLSEKDAFVAVNNPLRFYLHESKFLS